MKFSPYSYSRISTYQQCPRKFRFKYVDKLKVPFVYNEALIKGGCLHHILEQHPEKSSHKHQLKYQHIADKFISSEIGLELLSRPSKREIGIGLTENFEPCEYTDKLAMFRGSVDYFTIKYDYLWIVDYKSGKYKDPNWQSYDQNMWYGLYFFLKYKKIQKIKISYQYIEHINTDNSMILERKYLDNYIESLRKNINDIELDTEFKLKESKLCDYCDYQKYCPGDV